MAATKETTCNRCGGYVRKNIDGLCDTCHATEYLEDNPCPADDELDELERESWSAIRAGTEHHNLLEVTLAAVGEVRRSRAQIDKLEAQIDRLHDRCDELFDETNEAQKLNETITRLDDELVAARNALPESLRDVHLASAVDALASELEKAAQETHNWADYADRCWQHAATMVGRIEAIRGRVGRLEEQLEQIGRYFGATLDQVSRHGDVKRELEELFEGSFRGANWEDVRSLARSATVTRDRTAEPLTLPRRQSPEAGKVAWLSDPERELVYDVKIVNGELVVGTNDPSIDTLRDLIDENEQWLEDAEEVAAALEAMAHEPVEYVRTRRLLCCAAILRRDADAFDGELEQVAKRETFGNRMADEAKRGRTEQLRRYGPLPAEFGDAGLGETQSPPADDIRRELKRRRDADGSKPVAIHFTFNVNQDEEE